MNALWPKSKNRFYPAVILGKNVDGTFSVKYLDDDEIAESIPVKNIREIEKKKSVRFQWVNHVDELRGKVFF